MLTKIFILFAMLIILISLGSGLFFLMKDEGKTDRLVRALTIRIGLSLLLFIAVWVGFGMGWLSPHNV